MRGKHNIPAPSVIGHPEFERAYRVQVNTLEQTPIFFPALWLATAYIPAITWLPLLWIPAALGMVWVIGRLLYMQGLHRRSREAQHGIPISGIATILLILIALIGVVMTWIAVSSSSGGTASA